MISFNNLAHRRKHFRSVAPPAAGWTANGEILSPLDTYLKAVYKFEDGQLGTDSKGANHLTAYNTINSVAGGPHGNQASAGTAGYLALSPLSSDLLPTDKFTVSIWFKSSEITDGDRGFTIFEFAQNFGVFTGYSGCNELYIFMHENRAAPKVLNFDGEGLSNNTQYHLVVSADGTNFKAYLNGSQYGSTKSYDGTVRQSNGNPFHCCEHGTGATDLFDELYFWNGYGFTEAEAQALYNSGTGAFYTP